MRFASMSVAAAAVLSALALAACSRQSVQPAPARFDVLITSGRIVDGTGAPWFQGDIGITGDRITAIGKLSGTAAATAATTIDASNLIVAPGFIDLLGQSEFNHLVDGRAGASE